MSSIELWVPSTKAAMSLFIRRFFAAEDRCSDRLTVATSAFWRVYEHMSNLRRNEAVLDAVRRDVEQRMQTPGDRQRRQEAALAAIQGPVLVRRRG